MSGWWITVSDYEKLKAEPYKARDDKRCSYVASWEVDCSGLDWIESLLADSRATLVSRNAYPNHYRATVRELVKVLPGVLTGELAPQNWRRESVFNSEILASLPPETVLDVVAYDLT